MAVADIPFPKGSMPGQKPGEGEGSLVNTYCEVDAGVSTWRAVPGLKAFGDLGRRGPRGMFSFQNAELFVAVRDVCLTVSAAGHVAQVSTPLPGSSPVTWAQNNKSPQPDLVAVTNVGAYLVTDSAISAYPSADLPQPNSVSQFDGYLLFTIGDGRIYASGLNDTAIDALSFTTCQANTDGLLRGAAKGTYFFAFGSASVEVYSDAGTQPFPLARVTAIPVGLIGQWALTGYEPGWNGALYFIASDGTVCRMDGLTPVVISTKDVERDIASVKDLSSFRASVYVVAGTPFVTFSSATWTWEFNARTQAWHRRETYGQKRWRGEFSVNFNGSWLVSDVLGTKILKVSEDVYDEDGLPIVMTMKSGPVKQFPSRLQAIDASFDFTTGTAPLLVRQGDTVVDAPDTTDPMVSVSWSIDGGGRWSQPLLRSIGQGGQYEQRVIVRRLGLTSHHGMRFKLSASAGIYRTFRGGRMTVAERAA